MGKYKKLVGDEDDRLSCTEVYKKYTKEFSEINETLKELRKNSQTLIKKMQSDSEYTQGVLNKQREFLKSIGAIPSDDTGNAIQEEEVLPDFPTIES